MHTLLLTAATVGLVHTLLGPDHYVPFIVMARAGRWSKFKTVLVTFLCGIGHVLGSIVLGLLGVGLGVAVERLEIFESMRGNWAAWALIAFGLAYTVYGIHSAIRNKPHKHIHVHGDGTVHNHTHTHHSEHAHPHAQKASAFSYTPWVLFVVFILGPCEPLIPILMYPAAQHSVSGVFLVAGVFGAVTIFTMLCIVLLGTYGLNLLPLKIVERYSHALAGLAILLCGIGIQFLGL